ncbi:MAG TPA: tyrosine-type recombinase/integrase [Alphaproteobacteria bacterium]|nr:tyrosine-type recombinase/integrase [Alphaproteobacteria bacterium]
MTLTALAIKHLKPKPKLYRVSDSGGLCLEVSPAGGKLWRWRYDFNGKAQMLALGKFPEVTLEQARRKRDEARALLKAGKHPGREKKAEKLRRMVEGDNTFEKIARRWHEQKASQLNKKYHTQCLARMEQHVFPMIGALPITEITIPDVVRVVEKIGQRGTVETAKRMKQLIGQTFRYAAQRGFCQFNPASDLRDILPSTEEKHYGCIPIGELPALLQAMKAYSGDRLTKAALQLLAYTFVRTGELIGAQWAEIDFDRAEWHIPKERMKMRRPHIVPLSRQALALLKDLHAFTGTKTNVFHSQRSRTNRHISNGAVLMALRRMGYRNRMTGHGFRTLASTILNEKNYPPDVIERQLAHEDSDKIRAAYNRAEHLLERKKMMQDYADYLDEVLEANPDKVVRGSFAKGKERRE